MNSQPARSCKQCTDKKVPCVEEDVTTCTLCRTVKENCSLTCEGCIIGHHKCFIKKGDLASEGCDRCKRSNKVCKAGPTDPVAIKALRTSTSASRKQASMAANSSSMSSQSNGAQLPFEEKKQKNVESPLANTRTASASKLVESTPTSEQSRERTLPANSSRTQKPSPPKNSSTMAPPSHSSAPVGTRHKQKRRPATAGSSSSAASTSREAPQGGQRVESESPFSTSAPGSGATRAASSTSDSMENSQPLSPGTAYRRRTYDNRVRIYPFPDDYVPPSLPMLTDPPVPAASSTRTATPEPLPVAAENAPDLPAAAANAPEQPPFEDEINPTKPPADAPNLPQFLCCDGVHYIRKETYNEGALQLIDGLCTHGNYYPVDWVQVTGAEDWKLNKQYVGIVDLAAVLPGASMHEEADIYGCWDMKTGFLIRMLCPNNRPPIVGIEGVKDTSRDRFYLVPSDADFFCPVHNKYFHAFWARFWEKGQEFVDVDGGFEGGARG